MLERALRHRYGDCTRASISSPRLKTKNNSQGSRSKQHLTRQQPKPENFRLRFSKNIWRRWNLCKNKASCGNIVSSVKLNQNNLFLDENGLHCDIFCSGYMSPEYAIDGTFSEKSDVFSFGVLLLEIISGKRNRGFSHPDHHHNLLGHVSLSPPFPLLSLSLSLSHMTKNIN